MLYCKISEKIQPMQEKIPKNKNWKDTVKNWNATVILWKHTIFNKDLIYDLIFNQSQKVLFDGIKSNFTHTFSYTKTANPYCS